MPLKQAGGTELVSKVIGWEAAIAACGEVWDEFEKEFDQRMRQKIQDVKSQYGLDVAFIDPEGGGVAENFAGQLSVQQLETCLERVPKMFKGIRETALKQLEVKLLPQKTKPAKLGEVFTRQAVSMFAPKVKHRKKRKGVAKSKKKPHRKTGRPRGRPVRALFDPGSVRERRAKNRKQRREFRVEHRVNNISRAVRGLRPYPFRRAAKVEGWDQAFRDARIVKGFNGKYAHAAKRVGQ